jgi:hypothetical protein
MGSLNLGLALLHQAIRDGEKHGWDADTDKLLSDASMCAKDAIDNAETLQDEMLGAQAYQLLGDAESLRVRRTHSDEYIVEVFGKGMQAAEDGMSKFSPDHNQVLASLLVSRGRLLVHSDSPTKWRLALDDFRDADACLGLLPSRERERDILDRVTVAAYLAYAYARLSGDPAANAEDLETYRRGYLDASQRLSNVTLDATDSEQSRLRGLVTEAKSMAKDHWK